MCKGKEKWRRVSLLEQGHVWGVLALLPGPARSGKGASRSCCPQQGQIHHPCCNSWAAAAPGELLAGTTSKWPIAGCPARTWTPRACRQWVLGRGEEERRISDPNSICWRTWPAPRQAENSTYVSTCMQCWLCPRRALPSCCAPLPRPSPRPRSRAPAFGSRRRASSFWWSMRCFGTAKGCWAPFAVPFLR